MGTPGPHSPGRIANGIPWKSETPIVGFSEYNHKAIMVGIVIIRKERQNYWNLEERS